MKICLVCHKYGVAIDDMCCYPLGYMYVSAELKSLGYDVKVLNYNLYNYDFVEEIKGFDIVGFTGFEEFAIPIIRDAKICKELGIRTMLGGALATFIPEVMGKYVDYLCVGEFPERSKIDLIPWPDYEGFGINEYHRLHDRQYMGILTSRGCPGHCTFCVQTCAFRVRKLEKVFAEIQYYKSKYKIDLIVFNDNTINLTKSRFMKICSWLKGRGLEWGASIRCDVFDEEMACAAKDSNCGYFVVGVESFNQDKLDYINKGIKVESIYTVLDLLQKYKIKYHGNVLVGFENESYDDVISEVNSIPVGSNIFPYLVQPFVGTKNGRTRLLTDEQVSFLTAEFLNFINDSGMTAFPALESMRIN